MKGRILCFGKLNDRSVAALIIDGIVEDLIADSAQERPMPGAIYRATVDRPMKGQGGVTVRLPSGRGFFRGAKGLKPGQNILVQVTSVAEPEKATPVSDKLLFKGRSAIVTPLAPGLNISRRIKDDDARIRLHDLATGLIGSRTWGVILRSAAEDIDSDDIEQELGQLLDLADHVMADVGSAQELLVAQPDAHELGWREWSSPAPDAIEEDEQALEALGVFDAIEAATQAFEALPGAGSMYVEATRALVAVDVNTGGDTSPAAALKANLATAKALPRALRVRGLGGQITIDFAPLQKRDRRQVEQALRAAFKGDSIETALVGWTPLGHFELQRKRERLPLAESLK